MRHVSLFTGIGGFELAASRVWGDDYEPVLFCEMDKFCQKVLKKHWPDVPIIGDVRDVKKGTILVDSDKCGCLHGKTKKQSAEARKQTLGQSESGGKLKRVDLLTGGFPCQPFSQAGKRDGTQDDRYLWPQMLRVIREFKPTWVVAENVAGILSMAQYEVLPPVERKGDNEEAVGNIGDCFDRTGKGVVYQILEDFKKEGYDVQLFVIPAVACESREEQQRDSVGGLRS